MPAPSPQKSATNPINATLLPVKEMDVPQMNENSSTPESLRGKYIFKLKLGKGTQGSTWLAEDCRTHKLVAIKSLNISKAENIDQMDEMIRLIRRESDVLKNLKCDNVPHYIESFDFLGCKPPEYFLVQEYIQAPSLDTLLRDKLVFTESEVLNITRQLLDILEKLHHSKPSVIHRDIKPSNILMDAKGHVYLIDFGIAAIQRLGQSGMTMVGTFGYTAPEQFAGLARPESDYYSLAATMVHLLSGISPDHLEQLCGTPLREALNGTSDKTIAVIERMLNPDVTHRLANAHDIREQLSSGKSLPSGSQSTEMTTSAPKSSVGPSDSDHQVPASKSTEMMPSASKSSVGLSDSDHQVPASRTVISRYILPHKKRSVFKPVFIITLIYIAVMFPLFFKYCFDGIFGEWCFYPMLICTAVWILIISPIIQRKFTRKLIKYAQKGYTSDQFELAQCYEYGDGLPQNMNKAFKWYLRAAQNEQSTYFFFGREKCHENHLKAKFRVAQCFEYGEGTEVNMGNAASWYEELAELGDLQSDGFDLAFFGNHALSALLPNAQIAIGRMYETGSGVVKDPAQARYYYEAAAQWYEKYADYNNPDAHFALGRMYEAGVGVPKNIEKALECYKLAARYDHPDAQYQLGIIYYDLNDDARVARCWFRKAAAHGHTEAKNALRDFYK